METFGAVIPPKNPRLFFALIAALLLGAGAKGEPRPAATSEWRGVWITRFEWTGGSADEIRARIRRMMSSLGKGNFNAVIFQVRGQGDVLYPSPLEPWSDTIPRELRREDPVALALAEAHRNGLEFHAWMNLLTIWQSREKQLPADRGHPFYRWANPKDRGRAQGVVWSAAKKPLIFGDSDYTWLTPGNPELEVYLRGVVLDFTKRYDVDGLHWDDRTAMPNGPSFDPVSLKRFKGRGNPERISDLRQWQRDQLTRMLTNIYVAATAERPGLLVSASPFGIYDKRRISGYGKYKDCIRDFGSDGEAWMRAGIVDALMPQVYWKEGAPGPSYSEIVRDWLSHNKSGRPIWPGSALGDYGGTQPLKPVQAQYVALCRKLKAGGNTFFSYSAASDAAWASRSLYPSKADVPKLSFKVRPKTGQVMGHAVDPKGRAIVDAWIRIDGRSYTYLSSADGFFAIPGVKPGEHTLTMRLESGKQVTQRVRVVAGKTARVDFGG